LQEYIFLSRNSKLFNYFTQFELFDKINCWINV